MRRLAYLALIPALYALTLRPMPQSVQPLASAGPQVYKVTLGATAFVCAATTCDVTIDTVPANSQIGFMIANITTAFTCASVCTTSTLSMIVGKGAGGSEYLASMDADAATGWFGDADAEMGTLLTRAAAINGGTFHTAATTMVVRFTSGTGNIGTATVTNLGVGSVTFYYTLTRLT